MKEKYKEFLFRFTLASILWCVLWVCIVRQEHLQMDLPHNLKQKENEKTQ